jgi:hypothetical protein
VWSCDKIDLKSLSPKVFRGWWSLGLRTDGKTASYQFGVTGCFEKGCGENRQRFKKMMLTTGYAMTMTSIFDHSLHY